MNRQDINDMEEYLVGQLKMMRNHTYPKEEIVLCRLLILVKELRVETSNINFANCEVENE